MPITWLDIILLVFMLVSGLLALARGFSREFFSIFSWVAAAIAAFFYFKNYREFGHQYIEKTIIADVVFTVSVFLIVLIFISIITIRIGDRLLDSRVGALDRTLGFVFGLFRGLILVGVAYAFLSWLVPTESQPTWVREAKSRPLLDYTANSILSVLPSDPEALINKLRGKEQEGDGNSQPQTNNAPETQSNLRSEDPQSNVGYSSTDRQRLETLTQSTVNSQQ